VDRSFDDEKELIEDEGGDLGLGINQQLLAAAAQPPGSAKSGTPAPKPNGTEEAAGTDDGGR
jgi:hypothetical protein